MAILPVGSFLFIVADHDCLAVVQHHRRDKFSQSVIFHKFDLAFFSKREKITLTYSFRSLVSQKYLKISIDGR
jgi:hypothetical protein